MHMCVYTSTHTHTYVFLLENEKEKGVLIKAQQIMNLTNNHEGGFDPWPRSVG